MKIEISQNDEYNTEAQLSIFNKMIQLPKFWIFTEKSTFREARFQYVTNYKIIDYGDIETLLFLSGKKVQNGVWYIYLKNETHIIPKPSEKNAWMRNGQINTECPYKPLLYAIISGIFTTYRGENGFSIRGDFF